MSIQAIITVALTDPSSVKNSAGNTTRKVKKGGIREKINNRVGTSVRVGKGNAENLTVHYLGINTPQSKFDVSPQKNV